MKRILIVGDNPKLTTGYARVARFVATTLAANGYHVKFLPCNADMSSTQQFNFELEAFNPQDRFGSRTISDLLIAYKPALVICFGEFAFTGYIGNVCRQLGVKSLYYYPVEGVNYPPRVVYTGAGFIDYHLTLQKFNYIVAYSQFGADNINKLLPGIVTDIIPHQVDTSVFKPLDRQKCFAHYFPGMDPEKTFIVGHIGRNQRRKGTDLLLQGFASFLKNYTGDKHPYLFMLLDPKDPHGYNLYEMAESLNLGKHLVISEVIGGKHGPEDFVLAEVYNTMDVAVFPHRAEGFGLPVLEAMACGTSVITTNYATPPEFGKDVITVVPYSWLEPTVGTNCMWAVVNPVNIGTAISHYVSGTFRETDTLRNTDTAAVARAQNYSVDIIGSKWLKLLKDLQLPEQAVLLEEGLPKEPSDATTIMDAYMDDIVS